MRHYIGVSMGQFAENLLDAKKRGMTLRSGQCDQCQKIIEAEFLPTTEVQTQHVNCTCGAVVRITYYP